MAKRKKLKIAGFLNKDEAMEAGEMAVGAVGGGIATLELIRNIPGITTPTMQNLRDAGLAALGLVLMVLPKEYGGMPLTRGLGAGVLAVSSMNAFMRYFSTPALGARRNVQRRLRVAGPNGSPTLQGRNGSPVLQGNNPAGPMQNNQNTNVQDQIFLRMKRAA